jgi:serine/threonine protein kinase
MAEHGAPGDQPNIASRRGDDQDESTLGGIESVSIYDSLLRAVAAGAPSVRIDAEVGPNGKFVLQQEVGSGAMGRVYRALDRYLLRDVAIKFILRPEGMNHDDFMALFWQEAHIIAHLDYHDNIVRILDVDRSSYPPFIVMEYLDGQSLEKMLKRGPIEMATALHIMIGAASGLREAHAKGVCHRDLKPSNLFIQKSGRVKLLDFGLARIRNHLFEASTSKAHFITHHAVPPLTSAGTPAYMAPEQWRGAEADSATDLWAMGAILYRLFANVAPFDAGSLTALSARVLSGTPPAALASLCPQAPPAVCELVDRLLRFDKSERPSSVSEVIPVLETALRMMSSDAERSSGAPASSPGVERRPAASSSLQLAHGSGPESPLRYWDKMLLVLVPGPDSGAEVFPEQLSTWLFHHAGVNFDTLFCPPGHIGGVAAGAERLKAALGDRSTQLRHICFITHGEGTAVVLRMLVDEARRLRSAGSKIELDVRSPFYRSRHVAILRTTEEVALIRPRRAAGDDTEPAIADMVSEVAQFRAATLPTPALHYVGIGAGKPELHVSSPAVKLLASFLARPEMIVAQETIAQTFEQDCAGKISSLVEPVDDRGLPPGGSAAEGRRGLIDRSRAEHQEPTVPGADGATQAEVFDDVVAFAREQHQRPAMMVVTGDAGVGKSTVLRRAARRLCGELIASSDGGAVLPILVPLYFASLTSDQLAALDAEPSRDRRGRVLHDVLLGWWCAWFNDTTYAETIGIEWVRARLRSDAVVVMFDGVDELITNFPGITIADFQQMVAFITSEYRKNGWLTVVLGIRSTLPGLSQLGASTIREVLRLTPAQAIRQFPATSAWLGAASDPAVKQLLCTPLILAQLNARRPPSNLRPSTHAEVVVLALTAILEQSDLSGKLDERGRPIDAQCWIDALMAVAWCMFRRLRGEIATSTLRFDGADLHRSWAEYLATTQQQVEGERLLAGFHLLCESWACDAVLHRTVLSPTGRGEVRFIHREWQDFLAARYLAQVVMYRHVDEFRHVGNTARISRMAGELLCQAGVCLDEAFVLALLRCSETPGGSLITANFAALVTNSRILMEGPAIAAFLSAVPAMSAISRCITLIGLGYRGLHSDDASAHDLRYWLLRVFQGYRTAPAGADDLGVMRSVAWCYRKAYARRFGGPDLPAPDDAWPGLDDGTERAVLSMMCSTVDGEPRFRAEHRSIQMALLEVQQVVAEDPYRPISGVHYLYCLCVARRHGAGIAELGRQVPALLAEGSPCAAAIEGYELVPELREILAACRRLELAG